jgi:hypothetical protein
MLHGLPAFFVAGASDCSDKWGMFRITHPGVVPRVPVAPLLKKAAIAAGCRHGEGIGPVLSGRDGGLYRPPPAPP